MPSAGDFCLLFHLLTWIYDVLCETFCDQRPRYCDFYFDPFCMIRRACLCLCRDYDSYTHGIRVYRLCTLLGESDDPRIFREATHRDVYPGPALGRDDGALSGLHPGYGYDCGFDFGFDACVYAAFLSP
ncbi:hypothetical protein RRF57_003133 [Xylaria bambusicola]|uniref:Secreted protein n=1 Tax=Xylaria bambusicola TaxID=326684 RepID=A0AAN7UEM1_9PEZI